MLNNLLHQSRRLILFIRENNAIYTAKREPTDLLYLSAGIIQARGMSTPGLTDQVKYSGWQSSSAENLSEEYSKNNESFTCPIPVAETVLLL